MYYKLAQCCGTCQYFACRTTSKTDYNYCRFEKGIVKVNRIFVCRNYSIADDLADQESKQNIIARLNGINSRGNTNIK